MKKKAIVFGSNGYLGRHIAYFLSKYGIEFIPVGASTRSIDRLPSYKCIDVTMADELEQLDFNVDYVFVFSGLTGTTVGFNEYESFINVNELGLLNILKCCQTQKSNARIVFPSTRLVYKGEENTPLVESAVKETKTIYAQNKLSCEAYLEMYRNFFGINYTVFRICVPFGNLIDQTYSYGTVGFFLKQARQQKKVTIFGDGSVKRTFTHVADLSRLIVRSIDVPGSRNEILNIGGSDHLSLYEVASLIAEQYGVNVELQEWPEDVLKVESGDTLFSDKKLKSILNVEYQFSLNSEIRKWRGLICQQT